MDTAYLHKVQTNLLSANNIWIAGSWTVFNGLPMAITLAAVVYIVYFNLTQISYMYMSGVLQFPLVSNPCNDDND